MLKLFWSFIVIFLPFAGIIHAQESIVLGEKLLNQGNIQQAKKIFLNHPNDLKSIEYLGDIESFEKNWDKAIEYYEELEDRNPNSAAYNFKLGGALGIKAIEGSKFQAALLLGDIKTHLKKAASLDPNHAEVRRALVQLYMELPGIIGGSRTIAESYASDLDRINEIDAALADAYIYKIAEYKDLAFKKYESALLTAKRKPELITRNHLNYELGEASATYEIEPELGKKHLLKYLDNYGYQDLKTPAWAYYRLAQIERILKNKEAATSYIEKSLRESPNFLKAQEERIKIQRL